MRGFESGANQDNINEGSVGSKYICCTDDLEDIIKLLAEWSHGLISGRLWLSDVDEDIAH